MYDRSLHMIDPVQQLKQLLQLHVCMMVHLILCLVACL